MIDGRTYSWLIDMSKVIKSIIDYWLSPYFRTLLANGNTERGESNEYYWFCVSYGRLDIYFVFKQETLRVFLLSKIIMSHLASFIVQFEFRNCWRLYILSQQIKTLSYYVENNSNIAFGETYLIWNERKHVTAMFHFSFESINKKEIESLI